MKYNALLFFLFWSGSAWAQQPNIIFITIDDLNDYVEGFDGHPQTETPNISRIADHGTSFLRAYASAPQCGPSRLSLFTGKDCRYTNVYHNGDYKCGSFRANFTAEEQNEIVYTLPEVLKNSGGYFTYSISKFFHCHNNLPDFDGDTPNTCDRSFSWNQYLVFGSGGDEDIILEYGNEHDDGVGGFQFAPIPNGMEESMQDYLAVDSAIAFLDAYASNPEQFCDRPFFLGLGFRRPHGPLFIPSKYYLEYYNNDLSQDPFNIPYNQPNEAYPYNGVVMPPQPSLPWNDYFNLPSGGVAQALATDNGVHDHFQSFAFDLDLDGNLPVIDAGLSSLERYAIVNDAERANAVMAYLAAIRYTDAQIGRLYDALEEHPELLSNTIIVILGDHGYSLGEKAHWRKGAMWETDTRAPLIISDLREDPVTGGTYTYRLVSFLDIFPTILELAGVEEPLFEDGNRYLDGHSLVPLLEDEKATWYRPVISSYRNSPDTTQEGSCFVQYSVRTPDYHYIRYQSNGADGFCNELNSNREEELYHLGEFNEIDPYEWNNLTGSDGAAAIIAILDDYLPDSSMYNQLITYNVISSGITANDAPSIFLYPNPAKDACILHTEIPEEISHIIVSDMLGNTRLKLSAYDLAGNASAPVLDISSLSAGQYMVTVYSQGGRPFTTRLIVL